MWYYPIIEFGMLGCIIVLTYYFTRTMRLIIVNTKYDIKLKKEILNNKK